MRCYTITALVVLSAGSGARAQSAAERLDPVLTRAVEEQHIPGLAIGIVQSGKLVYARGFGVMEIGKPDRPVTTQTLFHMASITKPFVATAIMQLWEQGKVDLDAPVKKYVPYLQLRDARSGDYSPAYADAYFGHARRGRLRMEQAAV